MRSQKSFDYDYPEDAEDAQRLFELKKGGVKTHSTFDCGAKTDRQSG
jgi:hypothetical protein